MKRGKPGSKRTKARKVVSKAARKKPAPGKPARAAARRPAAAPRRAARPAVPTPRPRSARQKAAAGPRRPLIVSPEGGQQLSDAVEAAQEDLRALPERPLFDPDRSGRDDDLAEMLGEEYVRSVTSGEEQGVELRDQAVPEEEGGPFVESSGQKEFAHDEDDAEPEPLPTTRRPQTRVLR